jgi:glutamate-ammonia-ligase adenylyltransferase
MAELFELPLKKLLQRESVTLLKNAAVLKQFSSKEDKQNFFSLLQQTPDPSLALSNLEELYRCDTTTYLKNSVLKDPYQLQLLLAILSQSQDLADTLSQNPEYLSWLFEDRNLSAIKSKEDLLEDLSKFMLTYSTMKPEAVIAKFKRREYLRIGLRDIMQFANISETTSELSILADVILEKALELALQELINKYGTPQYKDETNRINEAEFSIISLGKLGAMELNYSSDIDIIFIYTEEGKTSGINNQPEGSITNHEFYIKLAEKIAKLLTMPSEEGITYRIDLRLRPQGSEGELANSLNSCISYYRKVARLWERQALIKSRVSAGNHQLGTTFINESTSIVYPQEVQPYLLKEIRAHKDQIDRKLALKGKTKMDVKLGYGGIRELEFTIQALQLIYGGREEWIREGNSLIALMRLADKDFISYHQYSLLSEAYTFLRTVEHRLQIMHNLWTYCLPSDKQELEKLARRMGFAPENDDNAYNLFIKKLNHHRNIVRSNYDQLFLSYAQPSILEKEVKGEYEILPGEQLRRKRLIAQGFKYPEQTNKYLRVIYRSFNNNQTAQLLREQFDAFATTIITYLVDLPNPDRGIKNFQNFLISSANDEKQLNFLFNHSVILQSLSRLFSQSDFLSDIIIRKPSYIQRLYHVLLIGKLKKKSTYFNELWEKVQSSNELREKMEHMRLYVQQEQLSLGFLDVNNKVREKQIYRHLAFLAEACLEIAYKIALKQLTSIYGNPKYNQNGNAGTASFAIIALGRLGTGELDINSDLDLIFIYSHNGETSRKKIANSEFFKRLVELIIRILSSITKDGFLYHIDTRLRPGGMDGELAQLINSLAEYLSDRARIWQKQSFLKARFVAGDKNFGKKAISKIAEAVFAQIDPSTLADEINKIRERLKTELGKDRNQMPSIKSSAGSLFDVDFIIQYLWLKNKLPFPLHKDLSIMLNDLKNNNLLKKEEHYELEKSYHFLRRLEHQLRLIYDRPVQYLPKTEGALTELAQFMDYKMSAPAKKLVDDFSLYTEKVRNIYKRIVLSN